MTEVRSPPRGLWWWINWITALLGVAGLAWMIHRLDAATILGVIRGSGAALALCLALDVVATLLRARVLHVLLRPSQRMVGYPRVVVAQATGSALADLTPTGLLGDPARASMLFGHAPAPAVVSAIVSYDLLALYVPAAVLTIGALVVGVSDGLPPALEDAIVASAITLVACAAFLSWLVRRGLASSTLAFLARLRVLSRSRHERWQAQLTTLDAHLRELNTHARAERIEAIVLLVAARALGWVEMYLSLRVVGIAPDAGLFAALVLGQMAVGRVSSVVPLGIGVADAGSAALFSLLGLAATSGVTYALLRRIRVLGSALSGLVAMATMQIVDHARLSAARSRLRHRRGHAPTRRGVSRGRRSRPRRRGGRPG